jgi:glycosyltransferase involved in cell wall biosynthesis
MPKPIRVLHIVGAMNHGGVETWLMALLRRADRAEIAMDFLVHTDRVAAHDSEIAALDGRVIRCTRVHHPAYVRDFDRTLCRYGPYDVLHSHVHYFSGVTTTLARQRGVRVRIAHSHSDTTIPETGAGPFRAAYRMLMRRGMFSSATHLVAASDPAASALFGNGWRDHPRAKVIHCGVDFAPFTAAAGQRDTVRRELDIAPDETVLGHLGNFYAPKNHAFLCAIAALAQRSDPRVCVLCVGDGPLLEQTRSCLEQAGVRAVFTGPRRDVARMLSAMDVFVFPSLYEGLGLALVEAQASGLPCVVSTGVPREAEVVDGLLKWLPLASGAELWAKAVLEAVRKAERRPSLCLETVRRSFFSIESSFKSMRDIYCA